MSCVAEMKPARSGRPAAPGPTLWGLRPDELHDAFWHARGVQCVRRGRRGPLQRAAELFLLVEPDQLAVFSIATLSERLAWNSAAVMRVRLIEEEETPYAEHVVVDSGGLVERIERRYRAALQASHRVILTPRRRLAAAWMQPGSRRELWDRIRRSVAWSRVDHHAVPGRVFLAGDAAQERAMLDELVRVFARPSQSIDGLLEIEPGVWAADGEPVPAAAVRLAPLWLGRAAGSGDSVCLVGPAWIADETLTRPGARVATVRPIAEVDPAGSAAPAHPRPPRVGYQVAKRAFDMAVSLIALLLLAPVMAVLAIAIRLEDGRPVLFGHRRQGRGGQMFTCWKFRTMVHGAHAMVQALEQENLCDGPQVYIRNDPRVTRIGRLLRPTHLDELPQLWNVLLGQMSLVGPRPSPDDENQYCPAWRDVRLSVRPGIAGLWQLSRTRQPGEDFQEWIKYDMQYVQQASFWFDLVILARTARAVLLGRRDHGTE
jgi:lipopolysaccharide/colanic/teichoic acid biosynthesis glycosyltransferase